MRTIVQRGYVRDEASTRHVWTQLENMVIAQAQGDGTAEVLSWRKVSSLGFVPKTDIHPHADDWERV